MDMHLPYRLLLSGILCASLLEACAGTAKPVETTADLASSQAETQAAQQTSANTQAASTPDADQQEGQGTPQADQQPEATDDVQPQSDVQDTSASDANEGQAVETAETDATATEGETAANTQQGDAQGQQPEPQNVDYAAARKEILQKLRSGELTDVGEFWKLVEADPLMTQTLHEEVKPHGTNHLSALGGGSTVSLKYVDSADESAKAALKPDQDLRQTMYRSEIAYYRLCQILECSFDTPVTRPVKFSRADFNTLYNTESNSKDRGYKSKFVHLIWAKEEGTEYMYAAYKEWIPLFTGFPIEATSVWKPYLQQNTKIPDLDRFLSSVLTAGRPDDMKRKYTKIKEYMEGMTTEQLLQQISDIILIDFLTNNWDRFSGDQGNYGANCHVQPGGIIAIDNGAAFPAWHAPRVVNRLHLVQKFSRGLVQNLRMLNEDELLAHLFPNPTKEELKSFERFKERRHDALEYIDKLIAKRGEENVLVF